MKMVRHILSGIFILILSHSSAFAQPGRLQEQEKIRHFILQLGDRHWEAAVDSLAAIGPAALDALLTVIDSPDSPKRIAERAPLALGRIGASKSIKALLLILGDADRPAHQRGNAAEALAAHYSPKVFQALSLALKDETPWVRRSAAIALGLSRPEKAVPFLIEALEKETEEYVKVTLIGALARTASEESIAALTALLADENWNIRKEAGEALGSIGAPAMPALIGVLLEGTPPARARAAACLGRFGEKRATPILIGLLADEDPTVRNEATIALLRIKPDPVQILPDGLDAYPDARAREEILWLLGEWKSRETVPALIKGLRDSRTAWMAAVSLGKIGAYEAVPDLIDMLDRESPMERRAAAWALEKIPSLEGWSALLQLLHDGDPEIRQYAISALKRLYRQEVEMKEAG